MSTGDLIPDDRDGSEPASIEVRFALVIARMIETVRNSPEDMRQAVYDLARYKLQEQFTHADAKDIKQTQDALETAIRGVEDFSKQQLNAPFAAQAPRLDHTYPEPSAPAEAVARLGPPLVEAAALLKVTRVRPGSQPPLESSSEPDVGHPAASVWLWPHLKRITVIIAIIFGALITYQQRERLLTFAHTFDKPAQQAASQEQPRPARIDIPPKPDPSPVKPAPLRPTDYGVYAIANDSLIELQLLPGRPPDIRVAVSAALQMPSRTFLPNGRPKFIVFRREAASNISDRAEVRIIAKVAREFSAASAGKKPGDGDDAWIIRNVSFPFRSAPVEGNPEMYELHSENPELELTPGRYALVLKNQAYDFVVEGEAIDPKQCIERIVASNGTYYTDCKKP